MRSYQRSHISSLAARIGVAGRSGSPTAKVKAQRTYKAYRALYTADHWIRSRPLASAVLVLAGVVSVFAPWVLAGF
jgi:hypothetical protein